jgi:putative DNA primase/helicase
LTGNSLPRFKDDGGALAHRMIVLQMVKSFYGEEDTTLESRLKAELPGILLWSLEGLKRLRKQGKFTEPQSARDAKEDLADLASPERAFVGECCELGADKIVEKDALYRRFRAWCVASGQPYIAEKAVFSKNLLAAFTGQVRKGKLSTREGRVPSFHGLSVLPASDPSQTGVSEQEECPF